MFDFTREANLDQKNYKAYQRLQKILYSAAVVLAVYFFFWICVPAAAIRMRWRGN